MDKKELPKGWGEYDEDDNYGYDDFNIDEESDFPLKKSEEKLKESGTEISSYNAKQQAEQVNQEHYGGIQQSDTSVKPIQTNQSCQFNPAKKSKAVPILISIIAVLVVAGGILAGILIMKNKNTDNEDIPIIESSTKESEPNNIKPEEQSSDTLSDSDYRIDSNLYENEAVTLMEAANLALTMMEEESENVDGEFIISSDGSHDFNIYNKNEFNKGTFFEKLEISMSDYNTDLKWIIFVKSGHAYISVVSDSWDNEEMTSVWWDGRAGSVYMEKLNINEYNESIEKVFEKLKKSNDIALHLCTVSNSTLIELDEMDYNVDGTYIIASDKQYNYHLPENKSDTDVFLNEFYSSLDYNFNRNYPNESLDYNWFIIIDDYSCRFAAVTNSWDNGTFVISYNDANTSISEALISTDTSKSDQITDYYKRAKEYIDSTESVSTELGIRTNSELGYEHTAVVESTDSSIKYPILERAYEDAICPVMVQSDGEYGTCDEMLASCVNDEITMYIPPCYANNTNTIYTATKYDAYPQNWTDGLLTYDEFIDAINLIVITNTNNDQTKYTTYDTSAAPADMYFYQGDYYNPLGRAAIGVIATETDPLNLRPMPSIEVPEIAKMPKGTQVSVLGYNDEWCYVEYYSGSETFFGYASRQYIDVDVYQIGVG